MQPRAANPHSRPFKRRAGVRMGLAVCKTHLPPNLPREGLLRAEEKGFRVAALQIVGPREGPHSLRKKAGVGRRRHGKETLRSPGSSYQAATGLPGEPVAPTSLSAAHANRNS
jgi:hypothetical protein